MKTYDMPLVDWISVTLHKDSLAFVLNTIRCNKRLKSDNMENFESNKQYMEKILREEVIKQFNDSRRPILEVILNSIDARPKTEQEYVVNVQMTNKQVTINDNGASLDLEQILKLLIIPFNTEKDGIEEIGRFGVGFLSNFYYCVNDVNARIVVKTKTKSEQYRITFYCEDETVAGLRMRLKRLRGKGQEGTNVDIQYLTYDKHDTFGYLEKHLADIPSYMAKVVINNSQVNDRTENKWFVKPVELDIRGRKIKQTVGLRITNDHKISLTSQGVLVQTRCYESEYESEASNKTQTANIGATISFPAAVKVVEGRDEFKLDDNFTRCVAAVFEAYEACIVQSKLNDDFVFDMTGLFPELLAAFSITNIHMIANLDGIRTALLTDKKYVLTRRQYAILQPFLGESLERVAFRATAQACSFWIELYESKDELMEDLLTPVNILSNGVLFHSSLAMRNLVTLSQILADIKEFVNVYLVNVTPHGENPIMILPKTEIDEARVYINLSHPTIINTHKLNEYQIICDYFYLPFIQSLHEKITSHDDAENEAVTYIPKVVA